MVEVGALFNANWKSGSIRCASFLEDLCVVAQDNTEGLDDTLRLPIRLWVMSRSQRRGRSQCSQQRSPKGGSELWPPIRDNYVRNAVFADDPPDEDVGRLLRSHILCAGFQNNVFGEFVDDNQDEERCAIPCRGPYLYEIYRDDLPHIPSDNRVEPSGRLMCIVLGFLAFHAGSHILPDISR